MYIVILRSRLASTVSVFRFEAKLRVHSFGSWPYMSKLREMLSFSTAKLKPFFLLNIPSNLEGMESKYQKNNQP